MPPPDGSAGNDWNTEAAFRDTDFAERTRLEKRGESGNGA